MNNIDFNIDDMPLITFYVEGLNYFRDNIKSLLKKSNPAYSQYVYRTLEDVVGIVADKENPNSLLVYMKGVPVGYVPCRFVDEVKRLKFKKRFVGTISGGHVRLSDGILERNFQLNVILYDYD